MTGHVRLVERITKHAFPPRRRFTLYLDRVSASADSLDLLLIPDLPKMGDLHGRCKPECKVTRVSLRRTGPWQWEAEVRYEPVNPLEDRS